MKRKNSLPVSVKKYRVKDIQLNVAITGRGKPLVFVHGWSNNWFGWSRLAEELAPHYKLHLLDLPGFGDSDPLENYTLEILSDYLHEYVEKYAPDAVALVGGSMGTFLLVETMRKYRFKTKVILISTVFKRNKVKIINDVYKHILRYSSRNRRAHWMFEYIIHHPYSAYFTEKYINAHEFNKKLIDTYQIPGRKKITGKSYVQIGASIMNYTVEDYLRKIKTDILLIFGMSDKYTRPEVANQVVTQLNRKNIVIDFVEKAGHSPAYEQPEQTAKYILEFLGDKN